MKVIKLRSVICDVHTIIYLFLFAEGQPPSFRKFDELDEEVERQKKKKEK